MNRAQILPPTPENIQLAADSIRRGEVGGMPTETVYGLAGDGLNASALARIFETKSRPTFDPLILHVSLSLSQRASGLSALRELGLVDDSKITSASRGRIEKLMREFWPGPLTLVLPKLAGVPDLATAGLPSVAIRAPRHPVAVALIEAAGCALAAPSANRFGRISPTRARHVVEELGGLIDWVLDGGPCEIGVESTIVGANPDGSFSLLRPGGISSSAIEAALAQPLLYRSTGESSMPTSSLGAALIAPGMLESHYAPSKKLTLLPRALLEMSDEDLQTEFARALKTGLPGVAKIVGVLAFSGDAGKISTRLTRLAGGPVVVRTLSKSGSVNEAAHHLFFELRALDASSADMLFAEPVPTSEGLSHAIQDRLNRASAKKGHV